MAAPATGNPWPAKSSNVTCNVCTEVNEANWEDPEDDLLVCIKPECKRRYRPICRGCMRNCHKKSGKHNMDQDSSNFVHLTDWYNMTKIKKCDTDHTGITILKSGFKSVIINPIGAVGGYALADKAVLQLIRQVPEKYTKETLKKYATNLVSGIGKSQTGGMALAKNMAKSQALISGMYI